MENIDQNTIVQAVDAGIQVTPPPPDPTVYTIDDFNAEKARLSSLMQGSLDRVTAANVTQASVVATETVVQQKLQARIDKVQEGIDSWMAKQPQ